MKKFVIAILAGALVFGTAALTHAESQPNQLRTANEVRPDYPKLAMSRGITGHVVVEYNIDADGKAQDIKVVQAQPKRVFDEAAIEAVRKSTFHPSRDQRDKQTKRFVFDIAER